MKSEVKRFVFFVSRKNAYSRIRDQNFFNNDAGILWIVRRSRFVVFVGMEVRSLALRRNVDFHAVDGDRMHPLCICEQSPKIDFEGEGFHDEHRWRVVAPAMPQRQSRALNTYQSVMASDDQ